VESIWKALADNSRRDILILLKEQDLTPSEISERFNFSLPALSSHLKILKNSDLVIEKKMGKNRVYSLNKNKNKEIIAFFDKLWDEKLDTLKEYIEIKKPRKRLENE
jgi:DNA-binding transcriptional ArsR family regulator